MSAARPSSGETVLGVLGIVLYAATGLVYVSSGLVVPAPWLFGLWAVWAAGIWLLVRVFSRARAWTPLVAVGAVAFWWAYLAIGEAALGWTA